MDGWATTKRKKQLLHPVLICRLQEINSVATSKQLYHLSAFWGGRDGGAERRECQTLKIQTALFFLGVGNSICSSVHLVLQISKQKDRKKNRSVDIRDGSPT